MQLEIDYLKIGQTKVSLPLLLKFSFVSEKDFEYFLLDTPYVKSNSIINSEIAEKLERCNIYYYFDNGE